MTVTVADRVLYGAHAETVAAARVAMAAHAEERDAEGRSARFPDGWWLIPAAMVGAAAWGWLIVAAITAANAVQVGGL